MSVQEAQKTIITYYGPVSCSVVALASQIRLVVMDVDGVLTDGLIYMGNQGEELKAFHVRDGYGITSLIKSGVEFGIITGRQSNIVTDRANTLGIKHLFQGQKDKELAFRSMLKSCHFVPHQVAYIGDDLIDLPVMRQVGLAVAVADAHPALFNEAHYITITAGGKGAVRELCDLILLAQCNKDVKGQSV